MPEDDRPDEPASLRIETKDEDGAYVLELSGELDASAAEELELVLQRAETSGQQQILIDLERVEFIDSAGLRTLLAAAKRAGQEPYRLQMTHGTGFVADMFRLTALDRTLPFT